MLIDTLEVQILTLDRWTILVVAVWAHSDRWVAVLKVQQMREYFYIDQNNTWLSEPWQ